MKNFFLFLLLINVKDNSKGNILINPNIEIKLALRKILSLLKKYKDNSAMLTIKISTCPLDIVAKRGKLIPTMIKEFGLRIKSLFFIIKKVNNEILEREIKLKMFFESSYGRNAKGAKIQDANGGYFQPEYLDSSEFTGP